MFCHYVQPSSPPPPPRGGAEIGRTRRGVRPDRHPSGHPLLAANECTSAHPATWRTASGQHKDALLSAQALGRSESGYSCGRSAESAKMKQLKTRTIPSRQFKLGNAINGVYGKDAQRTSAAPNVGSEGFATSMRDVRLGDPGLSRKGDSKNWSLPKLGKILADENQQTDLQLVGESPQIPMVLISTDKVCCTLRCMAATENSPNLREPSCALKVSLESATAKSVAPGFQQLGAHLGISAETRRPAEQTGRL
uniref:Uncharacterized protein n=2 Tax=Trichuris muris TaxID=70415 RepID=A0A5S6R3G7_TRIMR